MTCILRSCVRQEGWNEFPLNVGLSPTGIPPYRVFRYTAPLKTGVFIAELQFVGFQVASTTTGLCPVTVTFTPGTAFTGVAPTVATAAPTFNYSLAQTPYITSIFPDEGTALGGTFLTINGTWPCPVGCHGVVIVIFAFFLLALKGVGLLPCSLVLC